MIHQTLVPNLRHVLIQFSYDDIPTQAAFSATITTTNNSINNVNTNNDTMNDTNSNVN